MLLLCSVRTSVGRQATSEVASGNLAKGLWAALISRHANMLL